MKVDLPEGQSGQWQVRRFEITPEESQRSRLSGMLRGRGFVEAGTYTGLYQDNLLWMSDTTDEQLDHLDFVQDAHGDVLITGLGLGMAVVGCLKRLNVRKVTVVELSSDVIALVAPTLQRRYGQRFEIIQADATSWQPERGRRWDCGWHDIWANPSTDTLREMRAIRQRYRGRVKRQACWAEDWLR